MDIITTWHALKLYLLGVGSSAGFIVFLLGIIYRIARAKIKRWDGYAEHLQDIDIEIARIDTRCEERDPRHKR